MIIIDTHCHLDDDKYNNDLDKVIKDARNLGVNGFIIPGADITYLEKSVKIAEKYNDVYFAIGVHPYDKEGFNKDRLLAYANHQKCVAVGECGLDYYRLPSCDEKKIKEKQEQRRVFLAQLDMAVELKKPVILHIRDANEDCYNILKEYASKLESGAVMHCYNASPLLLSLVNLGEFYFGIGGVLTFSNAKNLVKILSEIPKDRLILETDAPYLTPHPHRGERNEPAYTTFVAKKMAEILNLSEVEVVNLTTSNAKRLFKCFETE